MTRRKHPWLLFAALAIVAPILSGCTGASPVLNASWPGLSVEDGTVYLSYAKVYALNTDGTPKWSFPDSSHQLASGQAFFARPAVDGNLVVVTDYTDSIFGLDRESGTQLWVFKSNKSRFIGGPVINDSLIYAATADGVIHAVKREAVDGVAPEAWSYVTGGSIWSTPLLADDTLYVTSMDKHVYALDAATGDLKWKYPDADSTPENPPLGGIVGTPTLHEGILYFGSFNNRLYALDTKTHEILWRYETTNWVWGSPVVDDTTGYVIAADLDGNVFAIDPASSEPKTPVWTKTSPRTDAQKSANIRAVVVGAPVLRTLDDGTPVVYVTSDGSPNLNVYRVADGEEAIPGKKVEYTGKTMFLFWETGGTNPPTPVKLYASPAFTDHTILVATHEGPNALYFLDANTLEDTHDPIVLKDVDSALLAKNGQNTDENAGGLLGNPQTILLMVGLFLLVSLVLRPGQQGGKK